MALEFAYTQSYEELRQAATILLEGSEGHIGVVILVKMEPINFDGTREDMIPMDGYVEVWEWDVSNHCTKQRGEREV
jgi:hypothetical protein